MQKRDLKKELKEFYNPSAKAISIVNVPKMNFLMIDGQGNPNTSPVYAAAVSALYAVAYTLKFKLKKEAAIDYGVMPLEGLWWVDDMRQFTVSDKSAWKWTMMIMQPEFVTAKQVADAKREVVEKKEIAAAEQIRLEAFTEGKAAHIMYFGAYVDEGPTIAAIHDFIAQNGGKLSGKHHEIYLGDPRRSTPEKLKTVIRQPFV
jgi:hypothetical protein